MKKEKRNVALFVKVRCPGLADFVLIILFLYTKFKRVKSKFNLMLGQTRVQQFYHHGYAKRIVR